MNHSPCSDAAGKVEGYHGRICPGEWQLHDEAALTELAGRMRDSPARRAQRERTLAAPSGHVYLGQFIAHDVALDPTPLSRATAVAEQTPNYRTPRLDLDHLYGNPPSAFPQLYENDGRFRIGRTLASTSPDGREIPAGPDDLPREPDGTPLIADRRNEENLIVAQLHLLLAKLHNCFLHLLGEQPALSAGPAGASVFEQARRLVTWHYQWIVRHDFLPLIVRKAVLTEIATRGFRFFPRAYTPADGPFPVPVEFTLAAFRFGHSMVQERYLLNTEFADADQLIRMTKRGGGIHLDAPALPASWAVEWDRFFSPPDTLLNRGRNIDTFITEALYGLPPQTLHMFGGAAAPPMPSLPEVTLRRGAKMRLPAGEELARRFGFNPLAPEQIAALPEDRAFFEQPAFRGRTPLWYYLLREAAVEGESHPETFADRQLPLQKLGTMGSHLVAETLLQILNADADSLHHAGRGWKPPLLVFGETARPRAVTSMRALVQLVRNCDARAAAYQGT